MWQYVVLWACMSYSHERVKLPFAVAFWSLQNRRSWIYDHRTCRSFDDMTQTWAHKMLWNKMEIDVLCCGLQTAYSGMHQQCSVGLYLGIVLLVISQPPKKGVQLCGASQLQQVLVSGSHNERVLYCLLKRLWELAFRSASLGRMLSIVVPRCTTRCTLLDPLRRCRYFRAPLRIHLAKRMTGPAGRSTTKQLAWRSPVRMMNLTSFLTRQLLRYAKCCSPTWTLHNCTMSWECFVWLRVQSSTMNRYVE